MKKHNIRGLNVVEFGEQNSPAIVLIHAFPFCNRMWDKQVEVLQKSYRVVAPDLRSFGYSEPGDGIYTIDTHVSDLVSIVDSLQLDKPVICGLSMGGYIALRAVELYQPKFKGVILADTKSEADTNPFKIKRFEQIRMIRNGQREQFTEGFIKAALSEKNIAEKPDLAETVKKIISWQSDKAIMSALLTMAARTDTTDSLEKFDLPLLIIVGKEDRLTPPEYSKIIYGKTKNSDLKLINDAAHMSNMENPEEFNNAVLDFMKQFKPKEKPAEQSA